MFTYEQTERLGIYQVQWSGATQQRFAVNLLDAGESNLEPRPAFRVGDVRVVAGQTPRQPRDLWKYVALAAFALLLVEWYFYNRRIYG